MSENQKKKSNPMEKFKAFQEAMRNNGLLRALNLANSIGELSDADRAKLPKAVKDEWENNYADYYNDREAWEDSARKFLKPKRTKKRPKPAPVHPASAIGAIGGERPDGGTVFGKQRLATNPRAGETGTDSRPRPA